MKQCNCPPVPWHYAGLFSLFLALFALPLGLAAQSSCTPDTEKPDFNKAPGNYEEYDLPTTENDVCPLNAVLEGLTQGQSITPGASVDFKVAGATFSTPTDMVSDNCASLSQMSIFVHVVNQDVGQDADDCERDMRVIYRLEDGNGNQRFYTQYWVIRDDQKPNFAPLQDNDFPGSRFNQSGCYGRCAFLFYGSR